jgi:hypothetical protein
VGGLTCELLSHNVHQSSEGVAQPDDGESGACPVHPKQEPLQDPGARRVQCVDTCTIYKGFGP